MQWIAISGSWRKFDAQVEKDVREVAREIISRGNGIVSGGALGVDYFATDEAMKLNPAANQIKIFLPGTLELYAAHCDERIERGDFTREQIDELIGQLIKLKEANPNALIEDRESSTIDGAAYEKRRAAIIVAADAVEAFQVNGSVGTQDTIDKALARGLEVNKREYTIE